jgi:hypothetical protein
MRGYLWGVGIQLLRTEGSHWLEWARNYVTQQECEAVETVLKNQRGPEPEPYHRPWDPEPKPSKPWGYACVRHTDGETTTDPTIGCCWDADCLDLDRVGIKPEAEYLSTMAGKVMLSLR